MRIAIFFGGQSREREISYLGGRTAYENLDKSLFEVLPIFVDSFGNFILLHEEFMYKNGLREFYGNGNKMFSKDRFSVYVESLQLTENELDRLINSVGKKILPQDFAAYFDFAFIALHGQPGEDGSLQGLFEWYNIPYSGCGLLSSAIGIDKITQNKLMAMVTKQQKAMTVINWTEWNENKDYENKTQHKQVVFEEIKSKVGFPFVAKAPHQGSSIGVAIIKTDNIAEFTKAINRCFFVIELSKIEWISYTEKQKIDYLQAMTDLDKGIAFPVSINDIMIYHPEKLFDYLNQVFDNQQVNQINNDNFTIQIFSKNCEDEVLFEQYIVGQEFSCGVIQDEQGKAIALPPTEIISASTFDFDSKYKSGGSRKVIPIGTTNENIAAIQTAICQVFTALQFNVCARIDGFLTANNQVILHDPNTIPGMSPASLIFKQTAEIGLNITQTLTYFIRASLQERIKTGKNTVYFRTLLANLDSNLEVNSQNEGNEICQFIDFEDNEVSFQTAKRNYSIAASNGQYHLQLRLNITTNLDITHSKPTSYPSIYIVPFALMLKESFAEMFEALQAPRHEMILKNIETAKELVKRYVVG